MKTNKLYSLLLALAFALTALLPIAAISSETAFAAQAQTQTEPKKQPAQSSQPTKKSTQTAKKAAARAPHAGTLIFDDAGALSDSDMKAVDKILIDASEKCGAVLSVAVLRKSLTEIGIGNYANGMADNLAKETGKGVIVFVQDVKSRKWYIATDKKMKPAFGKSDKDNKDHVEYISTAVVPHLKSNDLVKAYSIFAEKAGELAAFYNRTGDPMDVVDTTIEKAIIAIRSLVIGYAFASSRSSSRVAAMSNVQAASGASEYLDKSSFNLYTSNDSYLYQTVTAVPRPKSKSSGGGMSFSSSNSSHGGGGGSY